jgi:hypothetical protein
MPDRPDSLDTQTAAPPGIPPRRPIVGTAMGDDVARWDEFTRRTAQLQALERNIDAAIEANRAVIARLRDQP